MSVRTTSLLVLSKKLDGRLTMNSELDALAFEVCMHMDDTGSWYTVF